MNSNVDKIIDQAVGQVRDILVQAVQQVDAEARTELIERFNQTVGGSSITTVKVKNMTGSTRKTVATKKTATATGVTATNGKKPRKKRPPLTEEQKQVLRQNLAKARAAKAKKTKAADRAPAKKTKARTK